MKNNYKMYKVFDCQTMSDEIRDAFFEMHEASNDTYVEWRVDTNPHSSTKKLRDVIDEWLVDNGAEKGEKVLISHWW